MRTDRWLPSALLVLAMVACSSGPRGPGDASGAFSPLTLEPPPVYAILGYRADLGLTSQQIAALDSIALTARDESAPLLRELEERTGGGPQRGPMRVDPEDEPLVAEIRAKQRIVSEAVAGVLTEEQRGIVCRLNERRRETMEEGQRRPPPRVAADSTEELAGGRMATWHWCRPPAEDASD